MEKARGKGLKRERVLAHLAEPLPVDFEDERQLRDFERGVLKRLLAGVVDPSTAKAAVELGRSIFAAERAGGASGVEQVRRFVRDLIERRSPIDDEFEADRVSLEAATTEEALR